jgi:peptidyl-prolyl cis-trans isomerase SurA
MNRTRDRRVALFALVLATAAVAGSSSCSRFRARRRDIWALVNGTPIYADQVNVLYRRITSLPGPGKAQQALSFKLNILNSLIDDEIVLQRAAREQITISNREVEVRLQQIRSSYPVAEPGGPLNQQQLSSADLRREVRENLAIDKLLRKEIGSRARVTPAEVAAYYASNKADFNIPQTELHLAQILVTPHPDPQVHNLMHNDARTEQQAAHKVRVLYALLRRGENFAKVAEEYSEDPGTNAGGGDMGFVTKSALASNPLVWRAVRSLRVGQISRIIRDRGGYHIFQLLGRVPAGQRTLTDPTVQASIRRTLSDEKLEVLKAAFVENLRNQAHVVDYLAQQIVRNGGSAQDAR